MMASSENENEKAFFQLPPLFHFLIYFPEPTLFSSVAGLELGPAYFTLLSNGFVWNKNVYRSNCHKHEPAVPNNSAFVSSNDNIVFLPIF